MAGFGDFFGGTSPQMSGPLGSYGTGGQGPDYFAGKQFNGAWSDDFIPRGPAQPQQPMAQTMAGMPSMQPAAPTGNANYVSGLYQSLYGRAPDTAGLGFWTDAMRNGMSADDLRNKFTQSQEWQNMPGHPQGQQMGTGGRDMSAPQMPLGSPDDTFSPNNAQHGSLAGFLQPQGNMQKPQPQMQAQPMNWQAVMPQLMKYFQQNGGLNGLGGFQPRQPAPGSFGAGIQDAQRRGDPNSVYY